jgi:hypothetical protein
MINKILVTLLALVSFTNLYAQPTGGGSGVTDDQLQLNTITTAVPFMAITPDSRAGAMGDAGTALSANANSIYWNTAMLIFAEDKSEISLSYTPWLRQLTNDIHLSYLSGYHKIGDRSAITGALRFFSLGEITFTDASGNVIRDDKPSEYEVTGGYAFRLSDKLSVGLNGKFVYSNLTGGLTVQGVNTKPGIAGATDISFTYLNDDAKIGGTRGVYALGLTINNIGNKINYSDFSTRDFLPMNLKIGNSFKANFDKYNSLVFAVDLQKLLVPTPGYYDFVDADGDGDTDDYTLLSGRTNDVGIISGMVQSFYDAPGVVQTDENGDYVQNADGTYALVKNSRLKEELTEVNICAGLEYWYNDVLAIRAGYFYENKNKGNRQYFNAGIGFKYNMFGIDISYLAAVSRQNPLAKTLRFTLRYHFGKKSDTSGDAKPE